MEEIVTGAVHSIPNAYAVIAKDYHRCFCTKQTLYSCYIPVGTFARIKSSPSSELHPYSNSDCVVAVYVVQIVWEPWVETWSLHELPSVKASDFSEDSSEKSVFLLNTEIMGILGIFECQNITLELCLGSKVIQPATEVTISPIDEPSIGVCLRASQQNRLCQQQLLRSLVHGAHSNHSKEGTLVIPNLAFARLLLWNTCFSITFPSVVAKVKEVSIIVVSYCGVPILFQVSTDQFSVQRSTSLPTGCQQFLPVVVFQITSKTVILVRIHGSTVSSTPYLESANESTADHPIPSFSYQFSEDTTSNLVAQTFLSWIAFLKEPLERNPRKEILSQLLYQFSWFECRWSVFHKTAAGDVQLTCVENSISGNSRTAGILLYGSMGVGKSFLAKEFIHLTQHLTLCALGVQPANSFYWDVLTDLYSPESDLSLPTFALNLRAAFAKCKSHAPAVMVLDNFQFLASTGHLQSDSRIRLAYSEWIAQMDSLQAENVSATPVFVVAIAPTTAGLSPSSLSRGRLSKQIEVTNPTPYLRRKYLTQYFPGKRLLNTGESKLTALLTQVAEVTRGYLPASLKQLVELAMLNHRRTCCNPLCDLRSREITVLQGGKGLRLKSSSHLSSSLEGDCEFTSNFASALRVLNRSPKARIPVLSQSSTVSFRIPALDKEVELLKRHVLLPLLQQKRLRSLGISIPKGVLFYGPSGTGKTYLANHLITIFRQLTSNEELSLHLNFLSLSVTDVVHKVVGESEKAIHAIFEKARASTPCILFLDQLEAIAAKRRLPGEVEGGSSSSMDRMLSTLLIEMDGISGHQDLEQPLIVIAATHDISQVDPSILRSGRFDIHIPFTLPDTDRRKVLLRAFLSEVRSEKEVDEEQLQLVADATEGFAPAELQNLVQRAAMAVIRAWINSNSAQDLQNPVEVNWPSVSIFGIRAALEQMWQP